MNSDLQQKSECTNSDLTLQKWTVRDYPGGGHERQLCRYIPVMYLYLIK
jgi:hypothetical protein